MSDHSPELLQLAWTMLEQEWDVLQKMCKIAARKGGRRDAWEEAMSEVADRLPGILWSYDPACGRTLRSHVVGNCRWYLFKLFVSSKRKRERKTQAYAERVTKTVHLDDHSELERADEVQYSLRGLHPAHVGVLKLYYIDGQTYEEIGDVLGCSRSSARNLVLQALEAARANNR